MMTMTFTFAGMPNSAEIRKTLLAQVAALEAAATEAETPKATKGKKAKAAPVVEEDEAETDEELETADESEDEIEEDDAEEIEDEEETEEEPAPKKASSKIKLSDVIVAFQRYAKRHDRDAARKVLAKFKVKNVQDLDAADYAKVMKTLA
jgi:hypothetical protein